VSSGNQSHSTIFLAAPSTSPCVPWEQLKRGRGSYGVGHAEALEDGWLDDGAIEIGSDEEYQ